MDVSRSKVLTSEIDMINAIINNEKNNASVQNLFRNADDLSVEQKINKVCEIAYKILNSTELKNPELLMEMFEDLCPEANLGEFCVEFLKYQIHDRYLDLNEKIEKLESLKYELIPDSEIKMNYLNQILSLLLNQEVLDLEKINVYNNVLKELISRQQKQ